MPTSKCNFPQLIHQTKLHLCRNSAHAKESAYVQKILNMHNKVHICAQNAAHAKQSAYVQSMLHVR